MRKAGITIAQVTQKLVYSTASAGRYMMHECCLPYGCKEPAKHKYVAATTLPALLACADGAYSSAEGKGEEPARAGLNGLVGAWMFLPLQYCTAKCSTLWKYHGALL